jgi:hypothetical protein
MIRRRALVLVFIGAWVAAACGQGAATPVPSSAPQPVPSDPPRVDVSPVSTEAPRIPLTPEPATPSQAAASPVAPERSLVVLTPDPSALAADDAWSQVTAGIGRDGTIPLDVALQAFALTIGPLPGV